MSADSDVQTGAEAPPGPQPEVEERRLADPDPGDLSKRDYAAILVRGVKESLDDNIPNLAAALAYHSFLSIPSILLITVGVFGLVASPSTVTTMVQHLQGTIPASAIQLVETTLKKVTTQQGSSWTAIVVGTLLALWTAMGAMTTFMWAMNIAYERKETRGFLRQRLTALAMFLCAFLAISLALVLLVLGPYMADWIGNAVGNTTAVTWAWWIAQWPILIAGLLLAFAVLYYLGPNVDHPRWQFLSLGSGVAVVVWLVASGAFAFYASNFSSYNKTWGSISAVIIMLTWLWLTGLALLIGAEINSEAERSRELRRGEPAQEQLQAPAKA